MAMRTVRAGAGAITVILLWNAVAAADTGVPAGNAQAGRSFANGVCAPCHAIERGAKSSPDIRATPFALMVRSEKLTQRDIEGWLTSSHRDMPDLSVPPEKRADLIAYIRSLAMEP